LTDLDGFAAQVAALDLVITISNTTAHVAGALGVPCWVLLPSGLGENWYWFLDRDDSPWYPSVRLFRQSEPGVWTDVINNVGAAFVSR
jgi:ADP-heptose:LPS heptosyltransferase